MNTTILTNPARKAFTLLEMVAVLVLILVLAGIAVPTYRAVVGETRENAAVLSAQAYRDSIDSYAATQQVPAAELASALLADGGILADEMPDNASVSVDGNVVAVRMENGSDDRCATITLASVIGGQSLVAPVACGGGDPEPPTPTAQTIDFTAISETALSAGTVSLAATATSGLSVSFASTTESVCTVSGSTATLVTAGTCSITASQAGGVSGGVTYSAAADVIRSFEVTAAPAEFSWSANGQTFDLGGGKSTTISAVWNAASNVVVFSCSNTGTAYIILHPSASTFPNIFCYSSANFAPSTNDWPGYGATFDLYISTNPMGTGPYTPAGTITMPAS